MSAFVSLKREADAAVARKEWEKAQTLYSEAASVLENGDAMDTGGGGSGEQRLQLAKLHANLSMVCLKQHKYEEAEKHGVRAVAAAPLWGKAYARLGAAQQAKGLLLDAAESYAAAMNAEESFMGCRSGHSRLVASRRYKKLALIRKFQEEASNYDSYLRRESANPHNAVAAMNEEQKGILNMIRSGRVLPEDSSPDQLKEQDLILYLAAVDAGLHIMSNFPEYDEHPFTCPGIRLWLLSHGRDNDFEGIGDSSQSFDVYKDLLDFSSKNGADAGGEKEKYWKAHDTLMCMILFNPNRDFEDRNIPEEFRGIVPGDPWGPTITFKAYQLARDLREDNQCILDANFLVSLNYFILARAQQEPFLRWDVMKRPGVYWDVSQQKLKKSDDNKSVCMMAGLSDELTRFFIMWRKLDVVPRELYHHKWDG